MNLKKLNEVLHRMLADIKARPKHDDPDCNEWNKLQAIYFMNRILDVNEMIYCGKESTYKLDDMLCTWQESECLQKVNDLTYIFEL